MHARQRLLRHPRGPAPEAVADAVHYPGTYVAGCYNRLVSRIAGREVENEDIVNVPNWLPLTFRPEGGAWLDLSQQELLDYRQELDLRRGVLTRVLRVRDQRGRMTRVTQRRIVSMADPHLAGLEMQGQPAAAGHPVAQGQGHPASSQIGQHEPGHQDMAAGSPGPGGAFGYHRLVITNPTRSLGPTG